MPLLQADFIGSNSDFVKFDTFVSLVRSAIVAVISAVDVAESVGFWIKKNIACAGPIASGLARIPEPLRHLRGDAPENAPRSSRM
jgi:hypothetical protein